MNDALRTIILALIGGAIGAYALQSLQGSPGSSDPAAELSSVEDRLAALERRAAGRPPVAGLAARAPGDAPAALLESGEAEIALFERFEARLDAAVEKKITAMKESGELKSPGVPASSRKRVTLADAARALELSGQQEDGLRRIFDETNQQYFKLLAGPDGHPEDVKRELEEAARDPATARAKMAKYMPKFLSNIGEIMAIETKKAASINKLLGTKKAGRLESEFSVSEDDVLGLEGNIMVGATVEGDGR